MIPRIPPYFRQGTGGEARGNPRAHNGQKIGSGILSWTHLTPCRSGRILPWPGRR